MKLTRKEIRKLIFEGLDFYPLMELELDLPAPLKHQDYSDIIESIELIGGLQALSAQTPQSADIEYLAYNFHYNAEELVMEMPRVSYGIHDAVIDVNKILLLFGNNSRPFPNGVKKASIYKALMHQIMKLNRNTRPHVQNSYDRFIDRYNLDVDNFDFNHESLTPLAYVLCQRVYNLSPEEQELFNNIFGGYCNMISIKLVATIFSGYVNLDIKFLDSNEYAHIDNQIRSGMLIDLTDSFTYDIVKSLMTGDGTKIIENLEYIRV